MQWSFWYNIEFNFSFYFSKTSFYFHFTLIIFLHLVTLVIPNLLSVTFNQKLRVVHVHVSKMLVVENCFHKNHHFEVSADVDLCSFSLYQCLESLLHLWLLCQCRYSTGTVSSWS